MADFCESHCRQIEPWSDTLSYVTCDMQNMTCDMWHNYKYSLLSLHMKTKVVQHVPRINISISHITCDMWKAKCDMWHNYKYSLLSINMKTKVVQHVPRINLSHLHFLNFKFFNFFSNFQIFSGSQLLSDFQTFLAGNQLYEL